MTKEKSAGNLYTTAQGYGVSNQLKQYLTPGGWKRMLGEGLSGSFKERMDLLRDADKEIREEAKTLKTNFRNANIAFKENRYIDVAHWVSEIDQTVQKIVSYGKNVKDIEDKELLEYYTKTQDADLFKDYFGAKASVENIIIKEAALSDFFNKLLGNSFEQTYWKKIKERKLGVQSLVKQSERIVNAVLTSLKKMGDARATGNIGAWINEIERLAKSHATFHENFKNIYNKYIADLAAMLKSREPVSVFDEKSETAPQTTETIPAAQESVLAPAPVSPSAPADMTIPVEQKVKAPEEVSRGPGRPTVGDKTRQLDQLESLMKKLKDQPTPAASESVKVDEPVAAQEPEKPVEQTEAPVTSVEENKTQAPELEITVDEKDLDPEAVVKEPEVPKAEVKAPEPVKAPDVAKRGPGRPKRTQSPEATPMPTAPKEENKKITMVVIPKGAEDLDLLGPAVEQAFGRPVVFVSKESGYEKANEYKNNGFDIDLKTFDDVKGLIKKGPTKEEILEKLNDPEFISNLKRLGNGDFHFGEILDDPIFVNISSDDKKEIVSKLRNIRKKEIENKAPVDVSTTDPALIGLEQEVEKEPIDEEAEVFTHTGKLEKLLGKSLKDLTEQDSYALISNEDYLKMLPRTLDGTFDLDLIQKFPEYLVLDDDSKKYFIGPLNMMNKQILKDNKKKVAHKRFFEFFEKVAETNDTGLMAATLCKYSEEIDETDPELSVKLLQYAQSLLND